MATDEEHGRGPPRGSCEREGDETEPCRGCVEHEQDLPVRETAGEEPVMKVVEIGSEQRGSAHRPPHDSEVRVGDGEPQRHDWNDDCDRQF